MKHGNENGGKKDVTYIELITTNSQNMNILLTLVQPE